MMNEADYKGLADHLQEVRPIFDQFCSKHGFNYVPQKALGRYPRIRIDKPGIVRLWFDLWMQLDRDGRRLETFSPDMVYELSAGGYVDVDDGSRYGIRYQRAVLVFADMPFSRIPRILESELEKQYSEIMNWDADYLKSNGEVVRLG